MNLLGDALIYINDGHAVFPLAAGEKVPAIPAAHPLGSPERLVCRGECGLDGHGLYDATTNPDKVRRWWARYRNANIGIATGHTFDVLDVDTKHGAPGMESMERLRLAGLLRGCYRVVRTPTGGLHLHFAPSDEGNHALGRYGVDFRSIGGYVAAPPSVTADGGYQVLEERDPATAQPFNWNAAKALLDPPNPKHISYFPSGGNVDALARWVAKLTEPGRNCGLFWAACRAVEKGADPRELLPAAEATGLERWEAERTIESALRGAR